MEKVKRFIQFAKNDIWSLKIATLPKKKFFAVKILRIIVLSVREFYQDNCQMRASAQTFYTLVSIVPVFALLFAFAKGFGFEDNLQAKLLEQFPNSQEVIIRTIQFAHKYLEKARGGVIAGVGILILFWTVIRVLNNLEASFNDIWGIKKGRTLYRQFTDYFAVLVVCLFLLILVGAINIFVTSHVKDLMEYLNLGGINTTGMIMLKVSAFLMIWLMFAFLYIFMPNTKIDWSSSFIAAFVAGFFYQCAQWFFINCQFYVSKVSAIYGSFAALPLFLFWLQISWMILFYGAELAFACQSSEMYEFEREADHISTSFKRLLSLTILHHLIKNFRDGLKPLTVMDISKMLDIPIRLTRCLLYELADASLVSEVSVDDQLVAYQPGITLDKLSVHYVLKKLDELGYASIPVNEDESYKLMNEKMMTLRDVIDSASGNVLLKDM